MQRKNLDCVLSGPPAVKFISLFLVFIKEIRGPNRSRRRAGWDNSEQHFMPAGWALRMLLRTFPQIFAELKFTDFANFRKFSQNSKFRNFIWRPNNFNYRNFGSYSRLFLLDGTHFVDLGESFPTSIYALKSASILPRWTAEISAIIQCSKIMFNYWNFSSYSRTRKF